MRDVQAYYHQSTSHVPDSQGASNCRNLTVLGILNTKRVLLSPGLYVLLDFLLRSHPAYSKSRTWYQVLQDLNRCIQNYNCSSL